MDENRVYRILKMMQVLRLMAGEIKRASYYGSAADEVKKFSDITLENYKDVNAGAKILTNIKTILETILGKNKGTSIKELDDLDDEIYDKIYVLSEFIEIKGIGIKKAEKLYGEGKRSIEDLKSQNSNITK